MRKSGRERKIQPKVSHSREPHSLNPLSGSETFLGILFLLQKLTKVEIFI